MPVIQKLRVSQSVITFGAYLFKLLLLDWLATLKFIVWDFAIPVVDIEIGSCDSLSAKQ